MLRSGTKFLSRHLLYYRGPVPALTKGFCSAPGGKSGKDDRVAVERPAAVVDHGLEDEFTSIMDITEESLLNTATPAEALDKLSDVPGDISPQLAKELVEKVVAAASKSTNQPVGDPLVITPHVLRVIQASRMVTHDIIAPLAWTARYPIREKVTAYVDLDQFGLSGLAMAALEEIAGPRLKCNILTVNSTKYRSCAENQVHAIGLASRAIAEAMIAVGDALDNTTALDSWDAIMEEARSMAMKDCPEFQTLVDHVAALPIPTATCKTVPRMETEADYSVWPFIPDSMLNAPRSKDKKSKEMVAVASQ